MPLVTSSRSTQQGTLAKSRASLPRSAERSLTSPRTKVAKNLTSHAQLKETYAALPLLFEPNQGQTDDRVKFFSRGSGYSLFLTEDEVFLALKNRKSIQSLKPQLASLQEPEERVRLSAIALKFAGAAKKPLLVGGDPARAKSNYLFGKDPSQWRTGIPNYGKVEYKGIYPGIDAVFHGETQKLEFDFNVAPDADPRAIALEVYGARPVRVSRTGDIALRINDDDNGEVLLGKPLAYQEISGCRRIVDAKFIVRDHNRIGFSLGSYDHSLPLIIDPTLVYSTFFGPTQSSFNPNGISSPVTGVAVDASGFAYVVGTTDSPYFPIVSAFELYCVPCSLALFTNPESDAFVAKFDPTQSGANSLIYSTYLGPPWSNPSNLNPPSTTGTPQYQPSAWTAGTAIAVDTNGNAYISGTIVFTPTAGIVDVGPGTSAPPTPGTSGFISEIDPTGEQLLHNTFIGGHHEGAALGGSGGDQIEAIALDGANNVYVAGVTDSVGLASSCAYQPLWGGNDTLFVAKLDSALSQIQYYTYLFGSGGYIYSGVGSDTVKGIAVDAAGEAYVVGGYYPPQPLPSNGSVSSGPGGGIPINEGCGISYPNLAPAIAGFQPNPGTGTYPSNGTESESGFLAKLNATGTQLLYLTYLGGNVNGVTYAGINSSQTAGTEMDAVTLDANGNAYVTGVTAETNLPTTAGVVGSTISVIGSTGSTAVCTIAGNQSLCSPTYVAEINPTVSGQSSLGFLSYLPQTLETGIPTGVALDQFGDILVTGGTTPEIPRSNVANMPNPNGTTNSATTADLGDGEAVATFLVELAPGATQVLDSGYLGGANASNDVPAGIALDSSGNVYLAGEVGISDFPTTTTGFQPSPVQVSFGGSAGFLAKVSMGATGQPQIRISPSSGNFGTVASGQTPQITLTVSNLGQAPLIIQNITTSGPFTVQLNTTICTLGTLPGTLPVGASCTIDVMFSDPSTGTFSGSLLFVDNAPQGVPDVTTTGNYHQTYLLTATSTVMLTSITVSPANPSTVVSLTQAFTATGNYSDGSTKDLTSAVAWNSSNSGVATMNANVATAVAAGFSSISATVGTITGSTILTVSSPPQPAQVIDNETITVTDTETFPDVFDPEVVHVTDAVFVTPTINVTAPVVEFSAGRLGFSGQGGSQTITVSDIGQAPLTLSSAAISGSAQFTVTQVSCSTGATSFSTILPIGGACNVTIGYTASASPVSDNATLVFTDNAALSNLPSTPSGSSFQQPVAIGGSSGTTTAPPPPPAVVLVTDNERITVNDAESFPDVFDAEPIIVTDTVSVTVDNTSMGANVTVTPVDTTTGGSPMTLVFSNVTQGGQTTLTTSGTGPSPATGFELGNPQVYFNLSTTAAYTGTILICVNYTGISFPNGSPTLWHYSGGTWNNITTTVNVGAMVVCGATSSLSPFALFQPISVPTTTSLTAPAVTYGTPAGATVSVSAANGIASGNVALSVDGGTAIPATLSAGSATFNLGILSAGPHSLSASYSGQGTFLASSVTGTLTVGPAQLTITANSAPRPYGASNPVLGGTVLGIQNGDAISAIYSTAATPASPVGTYPILPTVVGGPAVLSNYSISLLNGTLSVVPETTSLSVTLSPTSIPVGQTTTMTITLTAHDMVIPIPAADLNNQTVLTPVAVTSPVTSDMLSNNGLCTPVPGATPGVASCTVSVTAVEPNGRTLNASFAGNADLAGSSGTANLIVTAALNSQQVCIASDFRNVAVPGGSTIWFNSIFKVRDVSKQLIHVTFYQSSAQFQYTDASGRVVNVNQPLPDAKITIDPSATTASTTFDAVNNVWITTIPWDLDDNSFLTGMPWVVPATGLPADVEPVTMCGTFTSDVPTVDVGWRWAAAAYSTFGLNATLDVKPMDTDNDNAGTNHDLAGTPENYKQYVIPGARGKGGKNFTGSYSRDLNIQ